MRKVQSWVTQLADSKVGTSPLSHLSSAFTAATRCHILGLARSESVAVFSMTLQVVTGDSEQLTGHGLMRSPLCSCSGDHLTEGNLTDQCSDSLHPPRLEDPQVLILQTHTRETDLSVSITRALQSLPFWPRTKQATQSKAGLPWRKEPTQTWRIPGPLQPDTSVDAVSRVHPNKMHLHSHSIANHSRTFLSLGLRIPCSWELERER